MTNPMQLPLCQVGAVAQKEFGEHFFLCDQLMVTKYVTRDYLVKMNNRGLVDSIEYSIFLDNSFLYFCGTKTCSNQYIGGTKDVSVATIYRRQNREEKKISKSKNLKKFSFNKNILIFFSSLKNVKMLINRLVSMPHETD
ncbi:hypothetical protein BpHYR1_021748 [Brachionus plicatilis]|uniref:Uncharacterized protein n=1 Tax=Brachionus plicatilis TaxID=10195 RepID=A0A3M7T1W6_BRAPC|nr:hypothetical protein BpHYR1_021748 [Brachionus plicatilis]